MDTVPAERAHSGTKEKAADAANNVLREMPIEIPETRLRRDKFRPA